MVHRLPMLFYLDRSPFYLPIVPRHPYSASAVERSLRYGTRDPAESLPLDFPNTASDRSGWIIHRLARDHMVTVGPAFDKSHEMDVEVDQFVV